MNYFPRWLRDGPLAVAPTDSRRRPDQRLYENGDTKSAQAEKTRLEHRQLAEGVETNEDYEPVYFVKEWNKSDGQIYHVYNNKYFEVDKP